jgi:anti-sigma-K factor RskA
MLNNMIQAYALGCLKPEEIRQIRKFSKNDPDFNFKELGKLQNLTALLPSALPIEIPDHSVKEKLARKLYRQKENTQSRKDVHYSEDSSAYSKDISKDIINRTVTTDSVTEKYSRITGSDKSSPVTGDIKRSGETKRSKELEELKVSVTPRYKTAKIKTITALTAAALLIGFLLGYLLFYENKDTLTTEISSLQTQIQELNSELIIHNGLLTLLEKKDIRILPLSGSEMYPDGYGKVYVHNSSNRAYLYLSGIPTLNGESAYQLWLMNGSNIYPAGTFNPTSNSDYYYFTFPRIDITKNTRIMLTEEPLGGSKKPGRKVYLTNQF